MSRKKTNVRKLLTGERAKDRPLKPSDYVSSGSTLLNLAITGNAKHAFPKGKYVFLVGDSSSGKTFISMTCLAEASINENFSDYRFILNDVEGGIGFDIEKFFGAAVEQRMEVRHSETVEDFYDDLNSCIEEGRPFIYVLDSMDALSSSYEKKKYEEKRNARKEGVAAAGDYGDGKAKTNSQGIRCVLNSLADTGSILIIINQTRDNVGGNIYEPRKIRSGGHALTFYAYIELWSSIAKPIKRNVAGKDRILGVNSKIHVRKSRVTGWPMTVEVPIYHAFGIDDIGSCIDYLVSEGYWKMSGRTIKAPELGMEGQKPSLISQIEKEGKEEELIGVVQSVWDEIASKCRPERKRKY